MTADFKDHFSTKSDDYALRRPTYPPELAAELAQLAPATGRALDVGCGTGQLTVQLAQHFDQVVGSDASASQIAAATPAENVHYQVAQAENLAEVLTGADRSVDKRGVEKRSVDLVTVAQATHWLDLGRFYPQVEALLKPGGVVALITYGLCRVEGVDEQVQHFYYEMLGGYWPPERRHVETEYRELAFPFAEVEFPKLSIVRGWTLDQLLGYFSTWSAVKAHDRATGGDAVAEFRTQLGQAWSEHQHTRRVEWRLTVRAGAATPRQETRPTLRANNQP